MENICAQKEKNTHDLVNEGKGKGYFFYRRSLPSTLSHQRKVLIITRITSLKLKEIWSLFCCQELFCISDHLCPPKERKSKPRPKNICTEQNISLVKMEGIISYCRVKPSIGCSFVNHPSTPQQQTYAKITMHFSSTHCPLNSPNFWRRKKYWT